MQNSKIVELPVSTGNIPAATLAFNGEALALMECALERYSDELVELAARACENKAEQDEWLDQLKGCGQLLEAIRSELVHNDSKAA